VPTESTASKPATKSLFDGTHTHYLTQHLKSYRKTKNKNNKIDDKPSEPKREQEPAATQSRVSVRARTSLFGNASANDDDDDEQQPVVYVVVVVVVVLFL
jgi:hypothetical protein